MPLGPGPVWKLNTRLHARLLTTLVSTQSVTCLLDFVWIIRAVDKAICRQDCVNVAASILLHLAGTGSDLHEAH